MSAFSKCLPIAEEEVSKKQSEENHRRSKSAKAVFWQNVILAQETEKALRWREMHSFKVQSWLKNLDYNAKQVTNEW